MPADKPSDRIGTVIGWLAIALFVVIYGVELAPHHGRPQTLAWLSDNLGRGGLIAVNVLMVAAFLALLPYRRATKGVWKSKGTFMSLVGVLLVALGWHKIHRAEGLVSDGIYRFVRHPQYTGLLLFTLGWIVHWPSIVTLALWPILVAAYVWLVRQEEKQAEEEFGDDWRADAAKTKRFVPGVV